MLNVAEVRSSSGPQYGIARIEAAGKAVSFMMVPFRVVRPRGFEICDDKKVWHMGAAAAEP